MSADDWQARALAAEADVSRLHETMRLIATAIPDVIDRHPSIAGPCMRRWAEEIDATLTTTPTPPAAVAALVRAARAVTDALGECDERLLDRPRVATDRSTYAYQYGCLEAVIGRLRTLLDAPPWRDLR